VLQLSAPSKNKRLHSTDGSLCTLAHLSRVTSALAQKVVMSFFWCIYVTPCSVRVRITALKTLVHHFHLFVIGGLRFAWEYVKKTTTMLRQMTQLFQQWRTNVFIKSQVRLVKLNFLYTITTKLSSFGPKSLLHKLIPHGFTNTGMNWRKQIFKINLCKLTIFVPQRKLVVRLRFIVATFQQSG